MLLKIILKICNICYCKGNKTIPHRSKQVDETKNYH